MYLFFLQLLLRGASRTFSVIILDWVVLQVVEEEVMELVVVEEVQKEKVEELMTS